MPLTVEFYGIPRQRAGLASLSLRDEERPDTLGQLWDQLGKQLPDFRAYCVEGNTLSRHCTANLDGQRFVADSQTPLSDVALVLVMSSDAGG